MTLCPLPLDCSEVYGDLTIASTSLHTPAWCAPDLSEVYGAFEIRGENVLVEGTAGRIARPHLRDEVEFELPMVFSGATDASGVPHTDGAAGLLINRSAFLTAVVTPITSGAQATLAASLVVPGVATLTAGVQPFRLGWSFVPGGYARALLVVKVPAGVFA